MKQLRLIMITLVVSILTGCSNLRGARLLMPEYFGLAPIADNVYIEADADEETKSRLLDAMVMAENKIKAAYGDVQSRPIVHACLTERCYESFGGMGSRAKVYGDRILLSPRGLNWNFLAHEWSHDEIRTRLTFLAWWRLPRWFDEGLAVAISEAPEHSEAHWRFLVDSDIERPSRDELMAYNSLRQWLDAVHRYGETKNRERKARGEPEIRPVYAAAGHEVRAWLDEAGREGLLDLLRRLNEGDEFGMVYSSAVNPVTSGPLSHDAHGNAAGSGG